MESTAAPSQGNSSLAEARTIVADLFAPNPLAYWTDFLVSMGIGMVFFGLVRKTPLGSPQQLVCFLISGLLYYRAVTFTHELAHLRRESFRGFRVVWNLLCGIPFLLPSFMYHTHLDHHRATHYGTPRDGRYLPLRHRPRWWIVAYLAASLVIPALAVVRFLLLAPLGWIYPRLGDWLYRRASSMVIHPGYVRPPATPELMRIARLQEAACFGWCLGWAVLPPLLLHRWAVPFVVHAYLTAVFIILVNTLRTLGSHRWSNAEGEMTFRDQLLDSLNYPSRPWFTELWGPVGMRFHALHHFFPALPYHAMPEAHRRLMARLPADSPYRATVRVALLSTIAELWRQAGAPAAGQSGHAGLSLAIERDLSAP
jgi:fatty acid desaturase